MRLIKLISLISLPILGALIFFAAKESKQTNLYSKGLDVLSKESSKYQDVIGNSLNNAADQTTKQVTNVLWNVNDIIKESIINTTGKATEKLNETSEIIINKVSLNNQDEEPFVINVDFSKPLNSQQFIFVRGRKYILSLNNIPKNQCLYIDQKKMEVNNNTVEIMFSKPGKYEIKIDNCGINEADSGTILVN